MLPTCFTIGTTHAEIIRSPSLCHTKTQRLDPKISDFDSLDQSTDFHWSNVHSLIFGPSNDSSSGSASSPSSSVVVSLQQFDHEGLIHAVSCEQLVSRCVCYLNSVKHLCALIWGAVNWWFLRLVTVMNLSSAAEVTLGLPVLGLPVLMRASFIIAFDGFRDCTWGYIKSSWNLPDWLTFLS